MYVILCIDKKTRKAVPIRIVYTKREAIQWIERNQHRYPDCILDFVREGFAPVVR